MQHSFSDVGRFRHDFLHFVQAKSRQAETPFTRLRLGLTPVWLITQPEAIKDVLKASEEQIDKGRLIQKLKVIVGNTMLVLSGAEHRRRRESLHGLLAKGGALRFTPEICALIRRQAARTAYLGEEVNAHSLSARLALRIICLVLFGGNVLKDSDEAALVHAVSLCEDDIAAEVFRVWPQLPWHRRQALNRRRQALEMMGVVVDRVVARARDGSAVRALAALGISKSDLRDEVLTMLLAGYTTTSNAAAWVLYHLATVPGLADKVRSEAIRHSDASGELKPSELARCDASLDLVRETLRLYPSSHWFSRDVKSPIEICGQKLGKGDVLLISPWQFHRDPRFWEAPDEFRLGRDFGSRAFIPFGAGPRACLGMGVAMLELQLLALEFASAFEIEVTSEIPAGRPRPSITLVPPEINLRLRVRDPGSEAGIAA